MATTTTTHETVSEAPTADDNVHQDTLATIVAQTTSTSEDLPDWEVFNAACKATKDTIERVMNEPVVEPIVATDGGDELEVEIDVDAADWVTTSDNEETLSTLYVGDHVRDREESDATMVVVALPGVTAASYEIEPVVELLIAHQDELPADWP